MSNIINKVKDALHKDDKSSVPEGTHGHHNSKVANAADPRIDSDRDHRAAGTGVGSTGVGSTGVGSTGVGNTGYTTGGTHTTGGSTGLTGTSGTTGTGLTGTGATGTAAGYGTGPGPASNTAGPHSSDMMNKADPRVDSDMDGSRNMGANRGGLAGSMGTTGTTSGLTGSTGTTGTTSGLTGSQPHHHTGATGTGMTGTTGTTGASGLGATSGSGIGHSGTTGINEPGMGTHGTHHTVGTTGTTGYGSGAATGAGVGAYGSGPGPAPNTAGPHKNDMLNKADPRVDSNLDGSKTVGGDKTYQAAGTSSMVGRDPTDAAQVPPSVLARHVGEPSIEHDDHLHDRARRNSKVSHQEAHSGI